MFTLTKMFVKKIARERKNDCRMYDCEFMMLFILLMLLIALLGTLLAIEPWSIAHKVSAILLLTVGFSSVHSMVTANYKYFLPLLLSLLVIAHLIVIADLSILCCKHTNKIARSILGWFTKKYNNKKVMVDSLNPISSKDDWESEIDRLATFDPLCEKIAAFREAHINPVVPKTSQVEGS